MPNFTGLLATTTISRDHGGGMSIWAGVDINGSASTPGKRPRGQSPVILVCDGQPSLRCESSPTLTDGLPVRCHRGSYAS